jgi:RimJ/RimL family protein N-acetyltransferase
MHRLPKEVRTARLLLRSPVEADVAALTEVIQRSHEELKPWMGWAQEPQQIEQTRKFCTESQSHWQASSALNFLIVKKEGGEIIGGCGYPRLDWGVPKFEIGYWCCTDQVGHGYVSEATFALARHAFEALGAARVELRMDDRNERSWRVAERLGFSHEATLNNEVRAPDGSLRNTRIYAATDLDRLHLPDEA